jgi:hypothetical protein
MIENLRTSEEKEKKNIERIDFFSRREASENGCFFLLETTRSMLDAGIL